MLFGVADDPDDRESWESSSTFAAGNRPGIYTLVTIGALGRVAAPLLPMDFMLAVRLSGMAWGGAFLLFLLVYGPKLIGPRPDGRP